MYFSTAIVAFGVMVWWVRLESSVGVLDVIVVCGVGTFMRAGLEWMGGGYACRCLRARTYLFTSDETTLAAFSVTGLNIGLHLLI